MFLEKFSTESIFLIFIFLVIRCHGQQPSRSTEELVTSYPDCNVDSVGKAKAPDLRFRSPVLDTIIHNNRKVQMLQEKNKDWIFVMHGNYLQQLYVNRESANLTLIGRLDDSMWGMEYLEAQLISWRNYLILAVAFEGHIIIYEINEKILTERKEVVTAATNASLLTIEPIQELTISGHYRRMFFADPVEDKILLILALDDSELNARIRTYAWHNTFFDPVEDLLMPTMNIHSLLSNYFIVGRSLKNIPETTVTTYEIQPATIKLTIRQTLTIPSNNPHFINFLGKNYLIVHSTNQRNSDIYKMIGNQFVPFRQMPSKHLDFTHFIASKNFLVGTSGNKVIVVPNTRLNCVSSFSSRDADVTEVMTHINDREENFILLIYKRPSQVLLRIVEIEDKSGGTWADRAADEEEELKPNPKYKFFEEAIGSLRSVLLRNNAAMAAFRKMSNIFSPKLRTVKVQYPVTVRAGAIGIVKLEDENLQNPKQLLKRIADMSLRLRNVQRPKRFIESVNQSDSLKQPTRLKVQQLKVHNLLYNGNIIKGFNLDSAAKPQPILSIRTRLKTNFLNTSELFLPRHMRYSREPTLGIFDFITPSLFMRARQLNVTSINNVPWTDFYNSLFLKNRDKQIDGRLIMQAPVKIESLKTSSLNNLKVADLFNLVTPQVIHSDIVLAGLNTSEITADIVNGLDFANDVAFSGRDSFIKSPVIMHDLNVSGDFQLPNGSGLERSFDSRDEDPSVFYAGKIIINGTLTLNNLLLEDPAEIFVSGESLAPENLTQSYLMQQTEQEFTTPIIFGNALVETPHLSTTYLNDHPAEQHLSKSMGQSNPNNTLMIIFMSAEIEKDLICNAYISQLANISREAIRHGEVANITGSKIFEGPLVVNHLMTLELNDLPVHEMVLKSELKKPLTLKGPKFFEKLQVRNETFINEELEVNKLNSLPLQELLNNDLHLDNLTLPHPLSVSNVVFHKINGISFDKIFSNLRVDKNETLVLHKDLIVNGNAKFSENLSVDLINNVKWAEYQKSLVRIHENAVIDGHKRFLNELVITKSLNTPTVNGHKIEQIFSNVLSRSKAQLISGSYSFDALEVGNIDVGSINGVPTATFIDMRNPDVTIDSDIMVPLVRVRGNVKGAMISELKFSSIEQRLQELPQKPWRSINVLGNVHWNISRLGNDNDSLHKLAYLKKNAVTRTGNNIITGNVKLRQPKIREMATRTDFPKDIDFAKIAKDCLLRQSSNPQTIYAPKSFRKPLNVLSLEVGGRVNCNNINNIDILRLNASLYRLSSGKPLLGPLHFLKPPIVGHLAVQGKTNGESIADIYHDPKKLVPPIQISHLHIDSSLQLDDINDMSLDYLLRNRVTKVGPALEIFGFLTFENLVLDKEILLQSINGIAIDSLILKNSNSLQALTGAKTIEGDLILVGPAHVLRLNNIELVDSYQKSILKHLNYHFDTLTLDEATFQGGLMPEEEVQYMLGAPLDVQQSELAAKFEQRQRLKTIERDLAVIDNIISAAESQANKTQQIIYLDYDFEAQVMWEKANETIDKTLTYERQRLSLCERQIIQVEMTADRKRIFLSNVTSNVLSDHHHEWNAKLENFCSNSTGKVRCRATLSIANFTKSFRLRKFIENVKIFQSTQNKTGLILHAVDLAGKHNEVRMLKVTANGVEDQQSITAGIGNVLKIFQLSQNYSLLISAALIDNYPALSIYAYSAESAQFELTQVIDGDYDLIELLQIDNNRYHLILSCVQCQRISVFEYNIGSSPNYRIYQFIKPNQLIDKLVPFTTGDGSHYLLVLSEHGHEYYHLYKFSHVQGWQHFTYGYFEDIQLALPLVNAGSQLSAAESSLLILCNSNGKCGLVKAFMHL